MNSSAADVAEVPPGVTTVTLTVPVPEGEVTLTWVAETTLKLVVAVDPNLIEVVPLRLVPLMVTAVPPAGVPAVGLMEVTVGTAS